MGRTPDLDTDLLRRKVAAIGAPLTTGLGRVASRFVQDMLTGMLIGGSVRLSEIARALDEPIALHATHKRLSRNLGNPRVGAAVAGNLLAEGAALLKGDPLLVVDTFELRKPYAERMEFLGPATRRTFRGAKRSRAGQRGYAVCEIFAWHTEGGPMPGLSDRALELARHQPPATGFSAWNNMVVTPLAQTLFSARAPDFRSESDEVADLVRQVDAASGGRHLFAFDLAGRGAQAPSPEHGAALSELQRELPAALSICGCRFAARVPGDLLLLRGHRPVLARTMGQSCPTPYGVTMYKPLRGEELGLFVHFGAVPVRLAAHPHTPLWLVAVKGLESGSGDFPFLILTTEPMRRNRQVIWRLVWSFLSFWDAIGTNQALKRQFEFDDVRVLSYQRLRNLGSLVLAASFVEAQWPGVGVRKTLYLEPRSKAHLIYRNGTMAERFLRGQSG